MYMYIHIHATQVSTGLEQPELDKINLVCPISHLKIISPVTIPGCTEVFDRTSVLERIAGQFIGLFGCYGDWPEPVRLHEVPKFIHVW